MSKNQRTSANYGHFFWKLCSKTKLAIILLAYLALSGCSEDEHQTTLKPISASASSLILDVTKKAIKASSVSVKTPTSKSSRPISKVSRHLPEHYHAFADIDPNNDKIIKAPTKLSDCYQRLNQAGIAYYTSRLPLKNRVRGVPQCGSHDPIAYKHGPTEMSVFPHAIMDCRFALAFAEVEKLIQHEAKEILGQRVRRVRHLGTYNCRKMAKKNLVSEHSFANAIDIKSFILEDGTELSVAEHFGPRDVRSFAELSPAAQFIRSVSSKVYDKNIMSVSLGPFFDHLHGDHLPLDLAHYRLDGSRPLGP